MLKSVPEYVKSEGGAICILSSPVLRNPSHDRHKRVCMIILSPTPFKCKYARIPRIQISIPNMRIDYPTKKPVTRESSATCGVIVPTLFLKKHTALFRGAEKENITHVAARHPSSFAHESRQSLKFATVLFPIIMFCVGWETASM